MKLPIQIISILLFFALSLSAQAGKSELFGFTCKGTGDRPGVPSLTLNTSSKPGAIALFTGNIYAIKVSTGSLSRVITGFELQHATLSNNPVWIRTWIYSANSSGAPSQVLASGIMGVGNRVSWYSTSFKPITIPKNSFFFLAYDCPGSARLAPAPIIQAGTPAMGYRYSNSVWSAMSAVGWSYRVNSGRVAGGGQPLLVATSLPALGKLFTAEVHYLQTLPPLCFHLLGFSATNWGALGLPFDLTGLAGTGCYLHVPIVLFNSMTISPVTKVGTFSLPMPGNPVLLGASFYHQVLVQDAKANGLGVVTSNGCKVTIGK